MRIFQIIIISSLAKFSWLYHFDGPPLPAKAFIPVWNSPTFSCKASWNVSLNLEDYGIVVNDDQKWFGDFMNILYADVGLWPYYDKNGEAINGGIPQLGDLDAHLNKLAVDIEERIPDKDHQGLAVIDWEDWRPMYDRNWGEMIIYRNKSEELVKKQHPTWTAYEITKEAKRQFEAAAKDFMLNSIQLGRQMRPKALWGYYGFPRCYNTKTHPNCSKITKALNNQLLWLFNASTVVLPSIYLHGDHKSDPFAFDYARGNVLEAIRMSNMVKNSPLPVFPYVRVLYTYTDIFLNKEDMFATVTQSAELATSGVIIWGSSSDQSKEFCIKLKDYIDDFFGPLVRTLSNVAQDCSSQYCSSHGRCRFKFNPEPHHSLPKKQLMDLQKTWRFEKCVCNSGWLGEGCGIPKTAH